MRIYVYCNSCSPQWHSADALSDEGLFLGGHVCSSHGFIPGDMGCDGHEDWACKRLLYEAAYPDGFSVEYVERDKVKEHAGLMAAHSKHLAFSENDYKARIDAIKKRHAELLAVKP